MKLEIGSSICLLGLFPYLTYDWIIGLVPNSPSPWTLPWLQIRVKLECLLLNQLTLLTTINQKPTANAPWSLTMQSLFLSLTTINRAALRSLYVRLPAPPLIGRLTLTLKILRYKNLLLCQSPRQGIPTLYSSCPKVTQVVILQMQVVSAVYKALCIKIKSARTFKCKMAIWILKMWLIKTVSVLL